LLLWLSRLGEVSNLCASSSSTFEQRLFDDLALESSFSRTLRTLVGEDQVGPALLAVARICFANDLSHDSHPFLLSRLGIGVKVDGLAVCETNAEALLDILVSIVLLCESALAAVASNRLCGWGWGNGIGEESAAVVDKADSFAEVDDCALLVGVLVVSGQTGSL
jgi:hypothetical protein